MTNVPMFQGVEPSIFPRCMWILKCVSKLQAHFIRMVNILRNFNEICDFTFAIHSYDDEDNFPL